MAWAWVAGALAATAARGDAPRTPRYVDEHGSEPDVLIARDLSLQPGWLREIDGRQVTFAVEGVRRKWPLEHVLAVLRPGVADLSGQPPMVELVDGQRWVGSLELNATGGEVIAWRSDHGGVREIAIDRVRSIRFAEGQAIPEVDETSEGDVVRLVNGDVLAGFVAEVGEPVVIETDDQPVSVPIERVASLALLNPREEPEGMRLWLSNGTILSASSISLSDRALSVWAAGGETIEIDGGELRALVFDVEAVAPLGGMEPVEVSGPEMLGPPERPRVLDGRAPLGWSDVLFWGPLEAVYEVPAGADRFVTEAMVPEDARAWADLELVFEVDGREAGRASLDGSRYRQAFAFDVSGVSMTIRIEEGGRGPVQDAVVLRRPAFRVAAD